MKALLVALLMAVATPALAQSAALIDGVQMPAWRERAGVRVPLSPGLELRAGDRIVTGKDSRALIRLAEGSVVKLGANGTLRIEELKPSKDLFRAALQVLQGAFRFTTDAVAKEKKREVSVAVDQVTIGIRGTDVWGAARPGRQIVCLIEGAVQVGAKGEKPVTLNQPRQFYQRDKGKTLPVGFVEAKQLEQWGVETEIEAGKGAARRGGRFSVLLFSADDAAAANAVRDELRKAGYAAETAARKEAGKTVQVVRIRQLPSRVEAQALAERLKGQHGVNEPRVSP